MNRGLGESFKNQFDIISFRSLFLKANCRNLRDSFQNEHCSYWKSEIGESFYGLSFLVFRWSYYRKVASTFHVYNMIEKDFEIEFFQKFELMKVNRNQNLFWRPRFSLPAAQFWETVWAPIIGEPGLVSFHPGCRM